MNIRKSIAVTCAAGALAVSGAAAPAQAQGPIFTGGLVNVTLVDVVDVNNNQVIVQVPIGVAAAVCDINVAVLAIIRDNDDTTCTATADAVADATQQRGRGANG